MQIKEKPLKDLIPYARNQRKHSEDQVKKIASSIREFGFKNPVIVDKDMSIIEGHGRCLAAEKLGLEKVPVIVADDLSEAQVKAYRLADNRLQDLSEFDMDLVSLELEELQEFDFDLELTGFDHESIQTEPIEGLTDEDEVPEAPEEPTSKPGDLWILGEHRVLCGDSTNVEHVERLMNGEKADMVFTDPPYGVNFQSNMRTKSDKFDIIKNDDSFLTEWIPNVCTFSKGFAFVWTSWKVLKEWIDICSPIGELSNIVIWNKGGGGIGDLKRTFLSDYEVALVYHRGEELKGKRIGSVWSVGKDRAIDYKHPTQKPVELMEMGVSSCTKSGQSVMDLFLGSGSTLIACEKTNRICYGMELDPKYVDVIVKRWEDFTGKKAVLSEG